MPKSDYDMNLNDYADECRRDNDKWWWRLGCTRCGGEVENKNTCMNPLCSRYREIQDPIWVPYPNRNKAELIALMHSELSEALEGLRKDLQDEKLPHRKAVEVELVDCLIRIFDFSAQFELDLEGAYQEKRAYNATRADHSFQERAKVGGKDF